MARFKKILLVEDDSITIMVCERIMKMMDFSETIQSFENGQEAINFYKQLLVSPSLDVPELIFLDINMPVMNGWDFLGEFEKMKNVLPLLPRIFILSSTVDPEDYKRAESYTTVEGFISKPLIQQHIEKIK